MRKFGLIGLITALLLVNAAIVAHAQGKRPDYGPVISLEKAKEIGAAATAYGVAKGWNLAAAVVDNHGFLIYFERAENTQTGSIEIAIDKAKSAAMFRRPTAAFAKAMADGRIAVLSLRGAVASPGGIPIMVDGKVIGAIGVSGAEGGQDAEAAQAALDKVKM